MAVFDRVRPFALLARVRRDRRSRLRDEVVGDLPDVVRDVDVFREGFAAAGNASADETNGDAASLDGGNRLIVAYHWKIEHRAKNPFDVAITQLATPEGKALLGAVASVAGFNPTLVTIISASLPNLNVNAAVTDNTGVIKPPSGMTICKAGAIGLETSHAYWSSSIVRNDKQSGLAFYTSVGISPGQTHRIDGKFYIEFVKQIDGWDKKYACMLDGAKVWEQRG